VKGAISLQSPHRTSNSVLRAKSHSSEPSSPLRRSLLKRTYHLLMPSARVHTYKCICVTLSFSHTRHLTRTRTHTHTRPRYWHVPTKFSRRGMTVYSL
jgi:hypothetical protein